MKCPICGENTPDAWQGLLFQDPDRHQLASPGGDGPAFHHYLHFDWMYCANPDCHQLVIRGHDTYVPNPASDTPIQTTDTWFIYPRHSSRPLNPVVAQDSEDLAADYHEAVALLDVSHRMAAVVARSILADLLETYAGLTQFSLAARIDKFVADTHHPRPVREDLHYLREIADLSAHTKKNEKSDQLERIEISSEEAEWTLSIIERLFDYFIIAPARSERLRKGVDEKLEAANRQPITPLPPDPELPLEEADAEEAADREDPEGL